MRHLAGRAAFVTGKASGTGPGIAITLRRAGMEVVVANIRQDHLDTAQAVLGNGDVLTLFQPCS